MLLKKIKKSIFKCYSKMREYLSTTKFCNVLIFYLLCITDIKYMYLPETYRRKQSRNYHPSTQMFCSLSSSAKNDLGAQRNKVSRRHQYRVWLVVHAYDMVSGQGKQCTGHFSYNVVEHVY